MENGDKLKGQIKAANAVLREGIKLLPDDAKDDFKAMRGDIFMDEAISNAQAIVHDDPERTMLLRAYAIQQANAVVSSLWRLQLLPEDLEKKYRELPTMAEAAEDYNYYPTERKKRTDEIMAQHDKLTNEERELDIFKGVINGMSAKDAEKEYNKAQQQMQQAIQG